jgi:uncharacterized protein
VHRQDGGAPISDADIIDPALADRRHGLWLLDHADTVNVLCIPPLARGTDVAASTWNTAVRYAKRRRAFVIVDSPAAWTTTADALQGLAGLVDRDENAALYFPRITAADPLTGRLDESFAPCGAVAGVFARTDATRGIWKAPAGTAANLVGVNGLSVDVTEPHGGQLNRAAINTLREFPVHGAVVWGSRTLAGADALASEWKYVPVRRLGLFVEESLYRGTQWSVFEPNGEPLWAALRLNAGGFLHDLFRQGAFQGSTPRDAYFVKCDGETNTQADVDQGLVNILVGFAPLKPAEFVVVRIQQRTSPAHREGDNP